METNTEPLEEAARQRYGRCPVRALPIGESFSASVYRFVDADGSQYVLKRHGTLRKARQEIAALRRLAHLSFVPRLLATHEAEDHGELLMSGFDAMPWQDPSSSSPALVRALGLALRRFHAVREDSFDGHLDWHTLLRANVERYIEIIAASEGKGESEGKTELERVARARALLDERLVDVPAASEAVLIHLDLRPGNILVRDGRFVAIIDFEATRGGHPSMDLFKLWRQVFSQVPAALAWLLEGYGPAPWLEGLELDRLMHTYALYHGIAGLAWCVKRGQLDSAFADRNRGHIDAVPPPSKSSSRPTSAATKRSSSLSSRAASTR